MNVTLSRPRDNRFRRPVLRYDRHGDVVEVDALDDSCGATVLPLEPLLAAARRS